MSEVRPTWGGKTIPIKPVVHSWTSLTMYEQCPWKWYNLRVLKSVSEGQSDQMREGNERHKALELAVSQSMPLPDKYKGDAPVVEAIRNTPGTRLVEWQFGLTKNWTECRYFGDDVWLRGKIDVGVIGTKSGVLIDYKTGKQKAEYDQLGLFAIPAFVRWPYLESIKSAYIWLGENKLDPKVYQAADLPGLKEQFGMRLNRIDWSLQRPDPVQAFPKMPSGLCRGWCPVKSCEFWAPKKEK